LAFFAGFADANPSSGLSVVHRWRYKALMFLVPSLMAALKLVGIVTPRSIVLPMACFSASLDSLELLWAWVALISITLANF
jgi:hypothetical protein